MKQSPNETGRQEMRAPIRANFSVYMAVGVFSFFVNLLMLIGPVYMLQIYDRVLGSRSEATLIALSLLVAYLYLMMGLLDFVRGRVLTRAGVRFQTAMEARIFKAVMSKAASGHHDEKTKVALRDLESVQKTLSAPVVSALFDMPWTPVFLAGITIFHPWLGLLALCGGGVLLLITLINQITTRKHVEVSNRLSATANMQADNMREDAETLRALGMTGAAFRNWQRLRRMALTAQLSATGRSSGFTTMTKTLRLFLQSAMLGLGAYLVLQNQITPGAMIAASILMGRALAPIEMTINQWPAVQGALGARKRLIELLNEVGDPPKNLELERPNALLQVEQVTIIPPGEKRATVQMLDFALQPGQALGVIGPSGAGKSTLARAITGVWTPIAGKVRLDGAALEHYDPDTLGSYIGYLPQKVTLMDGTIAENIARLSASPDSEEVIAAARAAGAHEMILRLPEGYNTMTGVANARLSGGQIQRIGLARAFYGDPLLLVLDEPNSNLDAEGSQALNTAISAAKDQGKAVIIMAHRPAAIELCDLLLVLEQGKRRAFGPKDKVLQETVQNYKTLAKSGAKGGSLS